MKDIVATLLLLNFPGLGFAGNGTCDIVAECNVNIEARLTAVEAKNEELDAKNVKLESDILQLKYDVTALENVALPGKIPGRKCIVQCMTPDCYNFCLTFYFFINYFYVSIATCAEYAVRGDYEDGIFKILPSVNVEPFEVLCEFRKLLKCMAKFHYGKLRFLGCILPVHDSGRGLPFFVYFIIDVVAHEIL